MRFDIVLVERRIVDVRNLNRTTESLLYTVVTNESMDVFRSLKMKSTSPITLFVELLGTPTCVFLILVKIIEIKNLIPLVIKKHYRILTVVFYRLAANTAIILVIWPLVISLSPFIHSHPNIRIQIYSHKTVTYRIIISEFVDFLTSGKELFLCYIKIFCHPLKPFVEFSLTSVKESVYIRKIIYGYKIFLHFVPSRDNVVVCNIVFHYENQLMFILYLFENGFNIMQ